MNTISSRAAVALLVVLLSAACLPQPGSAYYVSYTGADLTALVNNPPISNWLLTPRTTSTADGNGMTTAQRAGWKKIGERQQYGCPA
jgi:hypothetical protein